MDATASIASSPRNHQVTSLCERTRQISGDPQDPQSMMRATRPIPYHWCECRRCSSSLHPSDCAMDAPRQAEPASESLLVTHLHVQHLQSCCPSQLSLRTSFRYRYGSSSLHEAPSPPPLLKLEEKGPTQHGSEQVPGKHATHHVCLRRTRRCSIEVTCAIDGQPATVQHLCLGLVAKRCTHLPFHIK